MAELEGRIRSGLYAEGQRIPPERTLADEFQVSRMVVRTAIAELQTRGVLICSPRCRPVVSAPAMKPASARRTFGLSMWLSATEPEGTALLNGIQHAMDHNSYRLVVSHARGDTWQAVLQSEAQFLEQMTQDQDIAGIILWYLGGQTNLPYLEKVRAAGIPMVFVDRRAPECFGADHVGVDNEQSAERIVCHLAERGHRAIAHVTNNDSVSTVAERLTGYRRAFATAGLPYRPELVVRTSAVIGPSPDDCSKVVDELLSRPDPPTAIFAINDRIAFGVVDALQARGLRVPEDVAVAGFDGVERWSQREPFLTTANQPFGRIGAQAVRLLVRRTLGSPDPPYRYVLLDAPLSVHKSTLGSAGSQGVARPSLNMETVS